jgi:hypothetical protein
VSAGNYTVQVQTADSEVIVARSLGETFRGFIGLALIGSAGGVLFATGLIVLIVGSVRRGRMSRPQSVFSQSFVAPAGWYPDSLQVGHQRWWDGNRWADHYV